MRHRDAGEAPITGIAKDIDGALHQALGGRPRQRAVQRIGLGKEGDVDGREFASKALLGRTIAFDERFPRCHPAHQACKLRAG